MITDVYDEHINLVHLVYKSVLIEHIHNFIPYISVKFFKCFVYKWFNL